MSKLANFRVQVQDYTGWLNTNMIGDTAESFMQCSSQRPSQRLMEMTKPQKGTNMRYDVIFMLDPMLDTEIITNDGELLVNDVILQDMNVEHPKNNISDFNVKDAQQ
ncbi:hypothetical protein Fot_27999 [Forsythia ovata]|uniref:Uncharacterized protein n=1 Tax=Forsythia ovata TaxID=205694 RepID=A0ABD1TN54_9LAMI